MRGTGQPLCSLRRELPPRLCTCCSRALWLLLQLNSLLRVPYVRMHFRLSDQASWVVASHKARFSGPGDPRTWSRPRGGVAPRRCRGSVRSLHGFRPRRG